MTAAGMDAGAGLDLGLDVVDAHHHLWDPARRPQPWLAEPGMEALHRPFTARDLLAETTAAGVSRTVLVQVLPDHAETLDFLGVAARTAAVAAVVGWADLTAPAIADTLAELESAPGGAHLAGIRHLVQGEADPDWLLRPDVRRGLGAVAAAGLVYDLLTLPHQLAAALSTVRALPQLTFVVDHLSKPPVAAGELEPWRTWMRRLAAEPNVYAKLSGLVTEADHRTWSVADLRPYTDVALEAFGPDRLMFGSDWPVCLLAAPYRTVLGTALELTSEVSADERQRIFAGTAAAVYGVAARQGP